MSEKLNQSEETKNPEPIERTIIQSKEEFDKTVKEETSTQDVFQFEESDNGFAIKKGENVIGFLKYSGVRTSAFEYRQIESRSSDYYSTLEDAISGVSYSERRRSLIESGRAPLTAVLQRRLSTIEVDTSLPDTPYVNQIGLGQVEDGDIFMKFEKAAQVMDYPGLEVSLSRREGALLAKLPDGSERLIEVPYLFTTDKSKRLGNTGASHFKRVLEGAFKELSVIIYLEKKANKSP